MNEYKKETNRGISWEHRNYILCKEIYHCTPEELEKVNEATADLHIQFYQADIKKRNLEIKRDELARKTRK